MSNHSEHNLPGASEMAHCVQSNATLESFDWAAAPSLDKKLFVELAGCAFITQGQNLIFTGPTTSGKTHLSNALAHIAQQAGHSVNLVQGHRLDARFVWKVSLEQYLIDCDLLLVDEPLPTAHLRELLKARHGRSTILITPLPAATLLEALMPPGSESEALRRVWTNPIVVEFKENS